jgi:hypothetical protein
MSDWTYKDTLKSGYRRPYVSQPSLRDVGVFQSDLRRPVVVNPDSSVSTEIMDTRQNKAGKWNVFPTIGPPSIHQLRQFNTERDAQRFIDRRHPRLGDAYMMYNDMVNY